MNFPNQPTPNQHVERIRKFWHSKMGWLTMRDEWSFNFEVTPWTSGKSETWEWTFTTQVERVGSSEENHEFSNLQICVFPNGRTHDYKGF